MVCGHLVDYPMDKIKISGRRVQEFDLLDQDHPHHTALVGPLAYLLYFGPPSNFRYWRIQNYM